MFLDDQKIKFLAKGLIYGWVEKKWNWMSAGLDRVGVEVELSGGLINPLWSIELTSSSIIKMSELPYILLQEFSSIFIFALILAINCVSVG